MWDNNLVCGEGLLTCYVYIISDSVMFYKFLVLSVMYCSRMLSSVQVFIAISIHFVFTMFRQSFSLFCHALQSETLSLLMR